MDLKESKKSSELIFDGEILHVYKDTAIIPGGAEYTRELIRHIGAVAVVALTDEDQVIMEKQFRYPLDKEVIEIPAGKLDFKEEDRLAAAKREFKEETGYTAKEWTYIGDYVPAAAYSDEIISIYLAKGLSLGKQDLDEDEFLEVFTMPLKDAAIQCINGEITDGKTIAGILKAFYMVNGF